jgi:hypothetical protein
MSYWLLAKVEKRRDGDPKFWQFAFDDGPDDFKVHAKVVMNDFIPHACNLLPGDLRLAGLGHFGEILDGLADDFQFAQRRVLSHAFRENTSRPALV